MSPIQGFTRFRKWSFNRQNQHFSDLSSAAVLTGGSSRGMPWRGVPDINPNWTDQDEVDLGSIDPVLPPYRTHVDLTVPGLGGPLDFDSIPHIMEAGVRGGVTPTSSSTSRTWTHVALSLTPTTLSEFTAGWSDDVDGGPTDDGMRFVNGVVESVEFSFDESLGPWMVSADWRFGRIDQHITIPTAILPSNLPLVFGADTALFINDTSGAIGNTQISDALHLASIRIENQIDVKRFANGSNSRFLVAGYGLSARTITASFTFAKTAAIINALDSETVDWLSADPVNRYVECLVTSPALAAVGIPYSWSQRFSGTWRTRQDEEIGGNAVVTLELTGRYDAGLNYPYRSSVVNTQSAFS